MGPASRGNEVLEFLMAISTVRLFVLWDSEFSRTGPGFSFVKTDVFARTILDCCERRSDDWSFAVKGRIEYYGGDLHAADCLYHHSCSVNFRYGFNVPLQYGRVPEAKRRKSGRPKDEEQDQAFLKMCSPS